VIQSSRDTTAGGDAELQTDVMRFFAILAICVIALTSLVESADRNAAEPAQATPAPAASRPAEASPEQRAPKTVALSVSPRGAGSSGDGSKPAEAHQPLERSVPVPPRSPLPAAMPRPAADADRPAAKGRAGRSLRFASPEALLRLVSGGQVRVFAAASGHGYRLTRDGRRFVPESLPPALYLMAPDTIPEVFPRTLAQAAGLVSEVTWGVTLSDAIRRRLAVAVEADEGGLLLIDAAGRVAPAGSAP
jgi:hypothetical protein